MSQASRRIALIAIATVMSIVSLTQPVAAATPLLAVDVAAFSTRAQEWTAARALHRSAANDQATQLAVDARHAEEDQVAAEEQARVVEADRARQQELAARITTSTTTVAPTAVSPTAAPTTAPTTTTVAPDPAAPTTTLTPTTAAPSASGGPTAAQWEVLRQCESSGNYGALSRNGRYRGAYQFSQATWDWVAGSTNPALVGVDPAAAGPADQDALALALWNLRGWAPWPICGVAAAAA